jgi:hypothetical protein
MPPSEIAESRATSWGVVVIRGMGILEDRQHAPLTERAVKLIKLDALQHGNGRDLYAARRCTVSRYPLRRVP